MTRPRSLPYHQGGESPPELVQSHPLGFLLPRAPNPNAAPPVLYSFFPMSPNDMDPATPTSPIPGTGNPTPSCPPAFAPSQMVNPRSSQLFLQSQEASPAAQPVGSPSVLKRQCITADSEISRQGLEELARLIEESKRAEATRISHLGIQIRNPPARVAKQTPKSDARSIKKPSPSTVDHLFSLAKALGGERLLDLVWTAYAYYVWEDETEVRREPSIPSEVDQS